MTIAESTRRPAVVNAIRAIAALTVVGSAAAATTLTVRADERVPTVVVAGEQAAAAYQSTPGSTAPAPTGTAPGGSSPAPGGAAHAPGTVTVAPGPTPSGPATE
ncbi:hypothetical protein ACWELQ_12125, partial [Nocardia sp. NPDC004722]